MRTITVVQTHDGATHTTPRDAQRYLDNKLGALLTSLARELAAAEKYTKMLDVLEGKTETFRAIVAIQDDMTQEED